MLEQYRRGRSSPWYWRQTIRAIVTTSAAEIWRHRMVAVSVAALSVYLQDLYMFSRLWEWVYRLDRLWYPHVIHSRWYWLVIDPWAYRLKPYVWTSTVVWCAILAALSWIIGHWRPRQHGLMITLFVVTQISLRIPFLATSLTDWLSAPHDPISFYSLIWYSVITFVAIPFSIVLGGSAGAKRGTVESLVR